MKKKNDNRFKYCRNCGKASGFFTYCSANCEGKGKEKKEQTMTKFIDKAVEEFEEKFIELKGHVYDIESNGTGENVYRDVESFLTQKLEEQENQITEAQISEINIAKKLDKCEEQRKKLDKCEEQRKKLMLDEGEIFEIIKNSHFISTISNSPPSREEREDMLENDCFKSLAKAIIQYQEGKVKE